MLRSDVGSFPLYTDNVLQRLIIFFSGGFRFGVEISMLILAMSMLFDLHSLFLLNTSGIADGISFDLSRIRGFVKLTFSRIFTPIALMASQTSG